MISIIVPIYNAEKYLHRCVDSILTQSYTDFELLLINDGSKDGSGAICDAYVAKDSRVRVFHKENGGVSSARNLGLDHAQGEWITFCDVDDYVSAEWLSSYMDSIDDGEDLVIQGVYNITNNGDVILKKRPSFWGTQLVDRQNIITQLFIDGVYGFLFTKLFRRRIIESHHIRFDIQSAFREDAQFFSKYMEFINKFRCIDNANYYYILPLPDKRYKGDLNYSILPIFQSLDRIYSRNIPKEICMIFYSTIKTDAIQQILNGRVPQSYHLDLYERMSIILGKVDSMKSRIVNHLILGSRQHKLLSKYVLMFIAVFTKQK